MYDSSDENIHLDIGPIYTRDGQSVWKNYPSGRLIRVV